MTPPFSPQDSQYTAPSDFRPPPPRWRRLIPAWLRGLVWVGDVTHYDAFLSYSWKVDRQLAVGLQSVLQRFLCPWYLPRRKTVFRDLSSLAMSSNLEDELARRLDRSTDLIVLASPEAAQSQGMEFEARHWLSRQRTGDILVVLTKGNFATWEEVRAHALPPALRGHMTSTAHWIDLTGQREQFLQRPLRRAQRNELIETLAQLLLRLYPGRSWDQLRGEERSQRHKTLSVVIAAVGVVLLLAMLAANQYRTAESRALAARAEGLATRDRSAGLTMALKSWETMHTQEARLAVARTFPQLLSSFDGHRAGVRRATFSTDGRYLLTNGDDDTAIVWDATECRLKWKLEGQHSGVIEHAAFSLDGHWIVTAGSDHHAQLWRVTSNEVEVGPRLSHSDSVEFAGFSPNNETVVTTSKDKSAQLWTTSGVLLKTLCGHGDTVGYAAFSPDGRHIVTAGDDNTAKIWDTTTGDLEFTLDHEGSVWQAEFSSDGKQIVTASADHMARVWNAATGEPVAKLKGHTDIVWSAVFSCDNQRVLTASRDLTARVWSTTGTMLATLKGHSGEVSDARFSPDGRWVVTASKDGTARVWNAANGRLLEALENHGGAVNQALFSPDGRRIVTTSADHTARLWSVTTDNTVASLTGHEGRVRSAEFSTDGKRIVTAGDDRTARVWAASTGRMIATLRGHQGSVSAAHFSQDGAMVLTMSEDGTAGVWDSTTESPRWMLGKDVHDAALSPDANLVVTASGDNDATVWSTATGQSVRRLVGHEKPARQVRFSADGSQILTVSRDKSARLWVVATGQQRALLRNPGPLLSGSVAPDGQLVVTSGLDDPAVLWNVATSQKIGDLNDHLRLHQLVFSPSDGRRILGVGSGIGYLWNAADRTTIAMFPHDIGGGVSGGEFSADGSWLLTVVAADTARLYTANDGRPVARLRGRGKPVFVATLSPDAQRVVTFGEDSIGTVHRILSLPDLARLLDGGADEGPSCPVED